MPQVCQTAEWGGSVSHLSSAKSGIPCPQRTSCLIHDVPIYSLRGHVHEEVGTKGSAGVRLKQWVTHIRLYI